MPCLYIIKLRDETCYCGITSDLVRRIQQHLRGENKYTWSRLPLVIKFVREFQSMTLARIEEVRIKKQGVTRWLIKNEGMKENICRVNYSFNSMERKSAP
jgi:predicted GIY-YIG superfamily endonuclease